jgi:hypothetical protein
MIDLRYLALTVISVFLALAVGLMMGSALGTPDRRDQVYTQLRSQFQLLRDDNQRVQEENRQGERRIAARDQALRDLMPDVIRGRLEGKNVAVIICSPLDEGPFWGNVETALKTAGADVGPILHVPEQPAPLSVQAREKLLRIIGTAPNNDTGGAYRAVSWLTRSLARGISEDFFAELVQDTGIRSQGGFRGPVKRFLILTGDSSAAEGTATDFTQRPEPAIAAAAQQEGARVIAAEPEAAKRQMTARLAGQVAATVDNIDSPAGIIAAILALEGHDGQFGVKPGAARALPPLE